MICFHYNMLHELIGRPVGRGQSPPGLDPDSVMSGTGRAYVKCYARGQLRSVNALVNATCYAVAVWINIHRSVGQSPRISRQGGRAENSEIGLSK